MKYFRSLLFLAAFLSLALHGRAQKAAATKVLIKRTYYDYLGRQLHEEYQYIRTANQLVVKHGYYKEYDDNGIVKKKYAYLRDQENGACYDYADFGKGPEPANLETYKMGTRHGASILWRYNERSLTREKSMEGFYYNGKPDGRWVKYDSDGSKLVENWQRGIRQGETIQYGTAGQKIREGYFDEGQPFSGTLDEQFDDGKPRSSISYKDCFREGPSQTWYPNGKIKTRAQYHRGAQVGTTRRYMENGEPDEATKAALAQEETEKAVLRADSVRQEQQAVADRQRQVLERHRQDSVGRAVEAAATAKWAEAQDVKTAETMLARAYAQQQALIRAGAQAKLCINLYNKLLAEYQAATGAAKLSHAQRLLTLVSLTESLYKGEQPTLNKAIRKENNLDKVLALTGI